MPYVAYIFAESLHASGVLAVVAAGLVRGRYAPEIVSAEMRIIARSVWNMLVFLLNSLVFMLIGIQLSGMYGPAGGLSRPGQLFIYGAARHRGGDPGALRLGLSRDLPAAHGERALRASEPAPPEAEVFIMSWCGMRGIVSLAAALALPLALDDGDRLSRSATSSSSSPSW